MRKIYPCVWFTSQAEEAAGLYTSLFKNSRIGKIAHYPAEAAANFGLKAGSVMTVEFEIDGLAVLGLNGGGHFKHTPALSFFVWCDSDEEISRLWQGLSPGGQVRMGLDKYPWAEKYGWTADQYGFEWQLMLKSNHQKIAPAFLFVDKLCGKGEEALDFYKSLFKDSKTEFMARDEKTKTIQHCVFELGGSDFVLMEGPGAHNYTFSGALSFFVNCENQQELDYFWSKLSEGGAELQCGWLKDKYGVHWQIIPASLWKLMSSPEPGKAERVRNALWKMTKLDIKTLEQA